MAQLKEVTNDDFQAEVIESDVPVLVDFYADWCFPCRAIGVAIEELGEEYDGKLKVFKCNVEQNSESVSKYGITGIPAILMFKDGELVSSHIGLRTKKDIRKDIKGMYDAE